MTAKNPDQTVMQKAIEEAKKTMFKDMGGPFGAAIINSDGTIISIASNTVLADHDASAHAEINAIRKASAIKKTHDLSGCILYTTAYPCPMCLSAIIWANIKDVYYGCRSEDADAIGFRDDFIYDYIRHQNQEKPIVRLTETNREACLDLFKLYHDHNKTLY